MSVAAEFLHLSTAVLRRAPRISASISQITNRPAIPGKLAAISHGKLQREASSSTPDLRRCLGHHDIFRRCVKAAEEDDARFIKETYYEDELDIPTSTEIEYAPIRTQITKAVKTMVRNRSNTTEAAEAVVATEKPSYGFMGTKIYDPETTTQSKRRRILAAMFGLKHKAFPHSARKLHSAHSIQTHSIR